MVVHLLLLAALLAVVLNDRARRHARETTLFFVSLLTFGRYPRAVERTMTVMLEAHPIEHDVWCDRCLRSTGTRFAVTLKDNPTSRMSRFTVCTVCDSNDK